jgi:cytochrome P450
MSGSVASHWLFGDIEAFARSPHIFPWQNAEQGGGLGSFRVLRRRVLTTCSPKVAHHVLSIRREIWRRAEQARTLGIVIGDGLLATEGPLWKKRHAMIQPLLRRGEMAALAPVVQRAAARRLEDWETRRKSGAPVPIVAETQRLAMEVMAEKLLSIQIEPEFGLRFGAAMRDGLLLLRERNTSMFPAPMWVPTPRNRRLLGRRRELDDFVGAHVDTRIAANAPERDDLLGALIDARAARSGEGLSRSALVNEAKTLFVAGYETTATTMTWTLLLLAQHPQVADKLRAELEQVLGGRSPEWQDLPKLTYTLQVVNEAMRVYPVVYNLARQCIEDDEIEARPIPRGSVMLISVYGLHRSAEWGEDVEHFRPERFAQDANWPRRGFLPFGSGEHVCVGSHFAYTELLISLAMIAQRFRLFRTDDAPIETSARITLGPQREILLRLEPLT